MIQPLALLLAFQIGPACPADLDQIYEMKTKGLEAPKATRIIRPEFTPEARSANWKGGSTQLEAVITRDGRLCNIRVISPLPFGLERKAVESLLRWTFHAARLNGEPVAVRSSFEVNFIFNKQELGPGEKLRSDFNVALNDLNNGDPERFKLGFEALELLSRNRYPPADAYLGLLLYRDDRVTQNEAKALALIRRAENVREPLGMFAMAELLEDGRIVAKDHSKALKLYEAAANSRSSLAQFRLAQLLLSTEPDKAINYLRDCAMQRQLNCPMVLARILGPSVTLMPEALAWSQWGIEIGNTECVPQMEKLKNRATAEQQEKAAEMLKRIQIGKMP